MELSRSHLEDAARHGVIAPNQVQALWAFLSEGTADTPSFRLTHILYYLGGLIAIGAMTLFMTLGWERFGGWGLFFIAIAYAAAGLRSLRWRSTACRPPWAGGPTAGSTATITPRSIGDGY